MHFIFEFFILLQKVTYVFFMSWIYNIVLQCILNKKVILERDWGITTFNSRKILNRREKKEIKLMSVK